MPALQLTADDHLSRRIDAVNLKHRLGDVETDCRDRLHAWLPHNRDRPNGDHFNGTYVPMGGPSTASKAEVPTIGQSSGVASRLCNHTPSKRRSSSLARRASSLSGPLRIHGIRCPNSSWGSVL